MRKILEKVSYHAVYDASVLDALHYARDNGFAGVQVAVEAPHLSFERLDERACAEIADFRRASGLRIGLHAPDDIVSFFTHGERLREGIFGYFDALLRFGEAIGCEIITVHPGYVLSYRTDTVPIETMPAGDAEAYQRAFAENLERLIDLAAGRFVLCLENSELTRWVRHIVQPFLDAGRLSLCWDIAKTHDKQGVLDAALDSFLWDNIEHVRQVHLHDIRDGLTHAVLGTGCVDFLYFLPRLAEAEVVDYCIEVRPREKALESLDALRQMIEQEGAMPS